MKVAVIGAWHVHTEEYALAVKHNGSAELVCCWDDDAERGRAFAEKMDIGFIPNLETIWNDKSIDSVIITTATSLHKAVLVGAANAGKNIFTEKVLALTNEDAEAIRDEIIKNNVTFMISFPHKTFPTVLAAKKLADEGKLGKIHYARVHNTHNGSTANWLPDHFYDESQTGGGAMVDLGAHPMYTLNWFLGEPVSIVSMFTKVTGKAVEDNAVSVIEFAEGVIGVSETGFVTDGNPYILEMSGEQGTLLVHQNTLEYCSAADTNRTWLQVTDLPEAQPLPIIQWIEAVAGNTPLPDGFGIDEAVSLTKFMAGAYESHKKGTKYIF